GGDGAGVEVEVPATEAEGDDRLAEGDDQDEAVALAEVPGRELPPARVLERRPGEVEDQRGRPDRLAQTRVEERRRQDQQGARDGRWSQLEHRLEKLPLPAGRDRIEDEVEDADDQVGRREEEAGVAERVRR